NDKIFQLSRVGFLSTLERVAILADDKTKAVSLHIAPGLMLIKYSNGKEEAQEELEIAYQGAELEINFNVQYLTDVLRNLHADDVKMAFGDANRSMLLTMPDNGDFKYIVMPMRI
ncbi:MAG: DNA polymerase III subunit beta, partial [Neisseriaceae bacterium]|nr:DNA polymerase III subunit beta [Neisseriaceae bacterium]